MKLLYHTDVEGDQKYTLETYTLNIPKDLILRDVLLFASSAFSAKLFL